MGYELIVATLGLAALFSYMFFKFGENTGSEHVVFQIILFGLITACIAILGSASFEATNCDFIPVNSTTTGSTVSYDFDRVCATTPNPGSQTFLEFSVWAVRLFNLYLVFYILFRILSAFGKLPKVMNRFKKRL